MSKCKHVMGIKSTYRPVSPSNEQVFKDDGILEDSKSHFLFLEVYKLNLGKIQNQLVWKIKIDTTFFLQKKVK